MYFMTLRDVGHKLIMHNGKQLIILQLHCENLYLCLCTVMASFKMD